MIVKEITCNETIDITPQDEVILLRIRHPTLGFWTIKVDSFSERKITARYAGDVCHDGKFFQEFEVRFSEAVLGRKSHFKRFVGFVALSCPGTFYGSAHRRISFMLAAEKVKTDTDKSGIHDRICLMLGLDQDKDDLEEFVKNLKKERDELAECRDFVKINW